MHDSLRSLHVYSEESNPHQQPLPTGPKASPKQRPAMAQLRVAMTELHISRTCRAVSFELMTYWAPGGTVFPAVQTMADDMGLKRRVVRHHIQHLERVGLWVRELRTGQTNLYTLHLPGEAQERFVQPRPRHVGASPPGTWVPPKWSVEVPRAPTGRSAARSNNGVVRSTRTAASAPPLEAVASTPSPVTERGKRPNPPPFYLPDPPIIGLASADEVRPHIEAMREIARKARNGRQTSDELPEPTAERRAAALKTFADFDATMDLEREIERLPKKSVASVVVEDCLHERMMGGSCDQCGFDDGTDFSPSPDQNRGL